MIEKSDVSEKNLQYSRGTIGEPQYSTAGDHCNGLYYTFLQKNNTEKTELN